MSWTQKFVLNLLPKSWSAAIEAESRAWKMRCDCGHELSVWDAGGIRYKAAGNPKRFAICPKCGPGMHTLSKQDAPAANEPPK